ncbi:MAG TPA: hypothetical protein VHG10_07065 [Glycomyces sp.]|nr:hypothetical protein [Glycomyces sp.]
MTYVPPERGDEPALDETRQLDFSPAPAAPGTGRPELGNGFDAPPVDPFARQPTETVDRTELRPQRDRVVFQFIWEAILLLLTLNALFLVYRREDELFGDEFDSLADALSEHALHLAPVLLAALAIGLSLRLGAVNLAVPSIAFAVTLATPVETDLWIYLGYVGAAAVVAGLLFTLLVAAFRVPAWFSGLAVGVVVFAAIPLTGRIAAGRGIDTITGWAHPNGLYLLGGAAALAIVGGFIGLAPGMRSGFSAVKRLADGEGERPASAVFLLLGGTVLSMLLAAGAGFVVFAYGLGSIEGDHSLNFGMLGHYPTTIELQVLAFAVVLLAGTSLWGRRGGVFGMVFATVAVWAGLILWGQAVADAGEESWQADYSQAIFAGVLLVGLFVSFALDRLGRPKEQLEADDGFYTQEMTPFEPPNGDQGSGLLASAHPDATPTPR